MGWRQKMNARLRDGRATNLADRARLLKKLDRSPRDIDAMVELSGVFTRLRRSRSAMKWARIAYELNPIYAPSINRIGWAYLNAGEKNLAIRWFKEATDHNPHDPQLWLDLANAYDVCENSSARFRVLKTAAKIFPQDPKVVNTVGRAYVDQASIDRRHYDKYGGCYDRKYLRVALPWYRRAADLDTRNADRWHNLGWALCELGSSEAIGVLKKAVKLEPRNHHHHYWLASALDDAGRRGEAIHEYKRAIFLKPDDEYARSSLGLIYADAGDFESANEQYRVLLKIDRSTAARLNEHIKIKNGSRFR